MNRYITLTLLVCLATLPACGSGHNRVNGSVTVNTGEKTGDVSTVNGAVRVARDATVGSASTVNGHIELGNNANGASIDTVNGGVSIGEHAKISGNVSTVNGGVSLGKAARVSGGVSTVNGGIALDDGADVLRQLANVNGRILLAAAHVGGGIKTDRGDIEIGANSRVEGGIHIEKSKSMGITLTRHKVPRVVIGPGAVVEGALKFEREVNLYVSDRATIGPVEGATPVTFTGDRPPD